MPERVQARIADLSSNDVAVQIAAAEALARLGEEAHPAAVDLVKALRSVDPRAREWCIAALEELGPPLSDQIDDLIDFADGESQDAVHWAITLLGRAGEAATASVPQLIKILENDSAAMANRERAAWALGEIGPSAASAIPILRDAAFSGAPRLSRLAKAAIESIGDAN